MPLKTISLLTIRLLLETKEIIVRYNFISMNDLKCEPS